MSSLEYNDPQGFILSGYRRMAAAAYYPLRIDRPAEAQRWLRELLEENRITRAVADDERTVPAADECYVNLAVSSGGLARLGFDRERQSLEFDAAFQEGMHSPRRSEILSDMGVNAPEYWRWGNAQRPADLLLLLFGPTDDHLKAEESRLREAWGRAGLSEACDPICASRVTRTIGGREIEVEHFGFADGISQPGITGREGDGRPPVAIGEFVLGYENEYRHVTHVPSIAASEDPHGILPDDPGDSGRRPFGRNGSYLVFRQLYQDVAAFWNTLQQRATDAADMEWLAAKMVGRWPSGAVVRPDARSDPCTPPENDFTYADDEHGDGVPLGAHIRRTNPRGTGLGATTQDSLVVARRHQILRRGRTYGPALADRHADDGQDRGLLFICLNANIERQFEFIQQSWMNNPIFGGLYHETDPLAGSSWRTGQNTTHFHIPQQPVRRRLTALPDFVTVRGGGYFFLPGLRALRFLADASRLRE